MNGVSFKEVRFTYPGGQSALDGVTADLESGTFTLVLGHSGSGKSTLLRAINGLVPHSTGGEFSGAVWLNDVDVVASRPRLLSRLVGFVHQDPDAHFVVDNVERDVALGLENLGFAPETMRRRVEEVLDALSIAHLRGRSPSTLSGGERQRCAIAGALVTAPQTLVLDEPISQLDPQGADDVISALSRLNEDLGTTVVMAEHRLDRVGPRADTVLAMTAGQAQLGDPRSMIGSYEGAPPVARLGRLLNWTPLPLNIKEARAKAAESDPLARVEQADPPARGDLLKKMLHATVDIEGHRILDGAGLEVRQGDVVAVMGRNGAGKTTLLRTLAGLNPLVKGELRGEAEVAYVPQNPTTFLFQGSVEEELIETQRLRGLHDDDAVEYWLSALQLQTVRRRHPRTLSGGERQRVAIAALAIVGAEVLLLDEPTRGMDFATRQALADMIRQQAMCGGAVLLATHDVELAAEVCTRAVILSDGEVIADGSVQSVLAGSMFAPQVHRVMPPFLTVGEVATAMRIAE